MKSHFKKHRSTNRPTSRAFTLLEVVVAISILGTICATVLVVMDQCIGATIDMELKDRAFTLARENMENLLANDAVEQFLFEVSIHGVSDSQTLSL